MAVDGKSPTKGKANVGGKKGAKTNAAQKPKRRKGKESYGIYVYKVLKQVHPDVGISSKAIDEFNISKLLYPRPEKNPPGVTEFQDGGFCICFLY